MGSRSLASQGHTVAPSARRLPVRQGVKQLIDRVQQHLCSHRFHPRAEHAIACLCETGHPGRVHGRLKDKQDRQLPRRRLGPQAAQELPAIVIRIPGHDHQIHPLALDEREGFFFIADRAKDMNPARSVLNMGIPFSLHSDASVTPVDPLLCMWTATARKTMSGRVLGVEETISVAEALHAALQEAAQLSGDIDKYLAEAKAHAELRAVHAVRLEAERPPVIDGGPGAFIEWSWAIFKEAGELAAADGFPDPDAKPPAPPEPEPERRRRLHRSVRDDVELNAALDAAREARARNELPNEVHDPLALFRSRADGTLPPCFCDGS